MASKKFQLPGEHTKPIAIVGGGYAGTCTLLHMLLNAANDPDVTHDNPLRIKVIERHPQQLRGGVAYGKTAEYDHKLNLSSKRVTPFMRGQPPAGFPTFDEYIEGRAETDATMRQNFANPKRKVFGEYMEHLIDLALERAEGKVKVDTHFGEVVGFDDRKPGDTVLHMKDGSEVPCVHAIMAVGNKDAARPPYVFNIVANANYLDTAYSNRANAYFERLLNGPKNTKGSSALVLGTGLSAMDNAMRLLAGGYKGKIVMMSRHGEMHPVYRAEGIPLKGLLKGEPRPESELPFMKEEPRFVAAIDKARSFDRLFQVMAAEFNMRLNEGYTGEEVVNHWERYVHKIYDRFPGDTVKYLTQNKTALNVMRVGTVPEVFDQLQAAVRRGQLEIVAGEVKDIKVKGGKFDVTVVPHDEHGKKKGGTRHRKFSNVLNGIGYDNRFDQKPGFIKDPFWSYLEKHDGFKPHVTHAGVSVTEDFTLLKRDGSPYHNITMVGVPVAGHMSITPYPYPEKEGSGTRVAAFSLNIQGILGEVLAIMERKFEHLRDMQHDAVNDGPVGKATRKAQPAHRYG